MLISTIRMENESGFGQSSAEKLPNGDGLSEVDVTSSINFLPAFRWMTPLCLQLEQPKQSVNFMDGILF